IHAMRHKHEDVTSVLESMRGATDLEVLRRAARDDSILLTEDNDFGELIFRHAIPNRLRGCVLLRMPTASNAAKTERLLAIIAAMQARMTGNYLVVGERRTRIRPLPG